jgi:hypothetical protein
MRRELKEVEEEAYKEIAKAVNLMRRELKASLPSLLFTGLTSRIS